MTVRVSEPVPPLTVPGMEQVTLASVLATEQAKVTLPVNPVVGATVIVVVAEFAALRDRLAGLAASVNWGTVQAMTVME